MTLISWRNHPTLDADHTEQMTLPIVVDVSHSGVTHEDIILAVARGVALLLDDENSDESGPWREILSLWSRGNIRKVVRRAKKSDWDKIQDVPGVVSWHGHAKVRLMLPHAVSERPVKPVARLQVSLDAPSVHKPSEALPGALHIALNPNVPMTTGKAAAQAGHVVQLAAFNATEEQLGNWADSGYSVDLVSWEEASQDAWFIQDAGFTEVAPGTTTACSFF